MAVNANEALLDALRVRAVNLARVDAGLRREILNLLRRVEAELAGELAASGLSGDITPFKRARLEAMLQQVQNTIQSHYGDLIRSMADEMVELADIETLWGASVINRAAGVEIATVSFTQAQLESIAGNALIEGAPSADWWSRQADSTVLKFADEVRKGMLQGETNGELVARVRENVAPWARRNAEALVRSSVQAVANDAHMATFEANDDLLEGYQHVSTLDDRTTLVCAVRDGLVWDTDHVPVDHNQIWQVPPLHWNCRSTMVPVLKSWQAMGLKEPPPSTRASMDGQVADVTTFAQWLRKKGPEFQDEVLGETRARMWRGNKISFSDLVDQTGRPLTIDELRRL